MQRDSLQKLLPITTIEAVLIICGLALRLLVTSLGHNYDFESFMIVAGIFDQGGNVYAGTSRYNYGPIWFNLIGILFQAASRNEAVFRYILVTVLSLTDLLIYLILRQELGPKLAMVFFLNPVSIIITGYHNQFDNLALLIGLYSILLIGDEFETSINTKKLLGLIVLGLSLITKHILFAFPFWLAVKQKGLWQKAVTILVPIVLFIASFIPYWQTGKEGILQNVLFYSSFGNAYFHNFFVPPVLQVVLTSKLTWILILILGAFAFRRADSFDSLLLYTCLLIIASPALANQYLVIVLPFVAANLNVFTMSYSLIATLLLLIDRDGLHIMDTPSTPAGDYRGILYPFLVCLLLMGFIQSRWSQQLRGLLNHIRREMRIQCGYESDRSDQSNQV